MFFLPNILCVHVRKLGTSVRKSTTKSDLQNLQNRYQCRSKQTSCSFVIHDQRRDVRERSHGFCRVASLVHACDRYRGMGFWEVGGFSVNFYTNFSKGTTWTLQPLHLNWLKCQKTGASAKATNLIRDDGWFAVKERGPMTNVHDWSDLRSLRSPNLGLAFSSRKKSM